MFMDRSARMYRWCFCSLVALHAVDLKIESALNVLLTKCFALLYIHKSVEKCHSTLARLVPMAGCYGRSEEI